MKVRGTRVEGVWKVRGKCVEGMWEVRGRYVDGDVVAGKECIVQRVHRWQVAGIVRA